MYKTQGVLVLLVLFIGLAHSFFWDIVVGEKKQLKFYYDGTLMHTADLPATNDVTSITYDPVRYRVLFADVKNSNMSISSFDLSTGKIQHLLTRITNDDFVTIAYDPVTQLLFWEENTKIYSYSLQSVSSNEAGNLLVTSNNYCQDIAVDSCGFIYWITKNEIERAAFDGSERQILIDGTVEYRLSLAIDQSTQKMYWIEVIKNSNGYQLYFFESADLNGKNRRTIYSIENEYAVSSLTISKDFLYWKSFGQSAILQLPKKTHNLGPKLYATTSTHFWSLQLTAANYTIKEQGQGTKSCEALKIPNSSVQNSSDSRLLRECTQDCIDKKCYDSRCQNYCFQGNCSVNAKGQPICSCKAGFSGERCEVNTCHKLCLNNGVCSLNKEHEPVCECTVDYKGQRCEVTSAHTGVHADNTTPQALRGLHREVRQVIKEEIKRFLQFFSDKIDEYEVKI